MWRSRPSLRAFCGAITTAQQLNNAVSKELSLRLDWKKPIDGHQSAKALKLSLALQETTKPSSRLSVCL